MAQLAHRPKTIDHPFLASPRFAEAAATVNPQALNDLLAPLLAAPVLTEPADAALGALIQARSAAQIPENDLDQAAARARERTRSNRIGTELAALMGIPEIPQGRSPYPLGCPLYQGPDSPSRLRVRRSGNSDASSGSRV
ncbi:hypothetical protein ABT025_37850 [Streptomyces sp. NPDC002809]|uniref:hypothetical protein n=1 Tax=Streptomyces sp. NPDC002809 TaxID=3154433 RepID=UPI0033243012